MFLQFAIRVWRRTVCYLLCIIKRLFSQLEDDGFSSAFICVHARSGHCTGLVSKECLSPGAVDLLLTRPWTGPGERLSNRAKLGTAQLRVPSLRPGQSLALLKHPSLKPDPARPGSLGRVHARHRLDR